MFKFVRSKSFLLGFFGGLLFVAMVNVYTAYPNNQVERNNSGFEAATEDFDAYEELGWPFQVSQIGYNPAPRRIVMARINCRHRHRDLHQQRNWSGLLFCHPQPDESLVAED